MAAPVLTAYMFVNVLFPCWIVPLVCSDLVCLVNQIGVFCLFVCFAFAFKDRVSLCGLELTIGEAGHELGIILLPQLHRYWDYQDVLLCLALVLT